MLRWGIALAAVLALGLATEARAQLPQGNGQVKFVPVDTTKNLATPLPYVNIPQPKGSYFDRLYNSLASVLPFPIRNRKPNLPGPLVPRTGMPQTAQSQIPPPQQPTTNTGGLIRNLLTAPVLTGSAK